MTRKDIIAKLSLARHATATRAAIIPSLRHFRIADGRLYGFNAHLAISTPFDIGLDACPDAAKFLLGVKACKGVPTLTRRGECLVVGDGTFSTSIANVDAEDIPDVKPRGEPFPLAVDFRAAFAMLAPFVGDDNARPFAQTIALHGDCATATNNIVIAQIRLGGKFPVACAVPKHAAAIIAALPEQPVSARIGEDRITFYLADGTWILAKTSALEWPDVTPILDTGATLSRIPEALKAAVQTLAPFNDSKLRTVHLAGETVTVTQHDGQQASVTLPGVAFPQCAFSMRTLRPVLQAATHADFRAYPEKVAFQCPEKNLRGALMGVKIV